MGCCASKKAAGEGGIAYSPTRRSYYEKHRGVHNMGSSPSDPPPQPKPDKAKTDAEKKVLKVIDVDFNVAQNARNHETDKYEITEERLVDGTKTTPQLVIRRGVSFDIIIKFDRSFDSTTDDLKLVFDTGPSPQESKGTRVLMILSDEDKPKEWGAKVLKMEGNDLHVRIFTPPTCFVAKWTFKFDSIFKEGDRQKVFRYTHKDPIYILFNPWCPDDQVYMDDEQLRQEFVLNDTGRLWYGTVKQIASKPWVFGQFEDFMLDCCFYLLDKSELHFSGRNNPATVARRISAIVNSADDQGVLEGNWSGDYSGGRSPLSWIGSVAIMEEYWRTFRTVKYGQCWVFSGVVTTVCRCLGLPARSVTNFASAHDVDGSITIDNHWMPDGKPNQNLNVDSVWNFHVWNDVWMARPDLPSGFGGWQAIDATPQETSDGVYRAGPMSVEAIKNGLVNLPYDGPFIFAEVNADRLNWLLQEDGSYKCVGKTRNSIGKFISTKSPYTSDRQDITHVYKFPEGSHQERTAVWRAVREGGSRQVAYDTPIEDMKFDLTEKEHAMYGQPFDVTMSIKNNSKEQRTVKVTLTATVVFYTGVVGKQIKSEVYTIDVSAGAAGDIKMDVSVKEYMDKLVDMCNIKISAMVSVVETKQTHCESDDFRLIKPDLKVVAPSQVKVGEQYKVEVSFMNPLQVTLTNAEFFLEGAGLQKPMTVKQRNVPVNKEAKGIMTLTAKKVGQRELAASFDSTEISDVTGSTTIQVVA